MKKFATQVNWTFEMAEEGASEIDDCSVETFQSRKSKQYSRRLKKNILTENKPTMTIIKNNTVRKNSLRKYKLNWKN